ncbi:MAG: uncharacterized protein QOK15_3417 [Nocardioidaceae bacterium]|nr:uncharacterized protein [Nocardioidaceae bacterium]
MELTHSFTVPVDVGTTWATFEDIARVAECFPGATVTSVDGDSFEGTVKVKLGPIALQYAGSGLFVERDETTRRLVLEAKGRDKRGNGTAGAHVTAGFVEVDPATTRVEVVTDLQVTGKPAQFGRGVMQDVSDKLLGQFVDCLASRVGAPADASTDGGSGVAAAPEAAASPADGPPAPEVAVSSAAGAGSAPSSVEEPAAPTGTDAIDLGRTVLPVLARSYGKWLGFALVALLLVRWVVRRRR